MKTDANPNPFHLLGLPVGATEQDIVERLQELSELAETDEERRRFRKAADELVKHPSIRRQHELLEMPGAKYREEQWKAFEHRNKRNPVDLKALAAGASTPRTEDFDLKAIIGLLLDSLLSPPAADIRPAVDNPPVAPGPGASPVELSDVVFG